MNPIKPIQLVMPMSGQGTRYQKVGYTLPKPLIPVNGTPMVERLLSVFPKDWPTFFITAKNLTTLPEALNRIRPEGQILEIEPHPHGPGHALEQLFSLHNSKLDLEAPVLVTYCDYGMVWDPRQFEAFVRNSNCEAAVVSYRGFHAHYLNPQTYAYSRIEDDRVVQVKEKGSFTDTRENEFASCGAYYFRTGHLLKEALAFQKENSLVLNSESYTSLTVEAWIQLQRAKNRRADVRVFEIPYFFQWGTPADLQSFEYWEKAYQGHLTNGINAFNLNQTDQILLPMAGMGTRFQNVTQEPKPLIPMSPKPYSKPMFQVALESLPCSNNTTLVVLESVLEQVKVESQGRYTLVPLKTTPAGQALSVEAGLKEAIKQKSIRLDQSLLISSCDHGIVLNPKHWHTFQSEFSHATGCGQTDLAIFSIRHYPGALRRPNAYAYLKVAPSSELGHTPFQKISGVSVKVPLSETPHKDPVLVGTFWFRSTELLLQGLEWLKARNPVVKPQSGANTAELYLDSIVDDFLAHGLVVREIPLEGYLCYGDPDSLAETLYWQEVFTGQKAQIRPRFPQL